MNIKLINNTGRRVGRSVVYEYGTDLFGQFYLEKFKGREKIKLAAKWILKDLGSLFRLLDLELYRREVENYENTLVWA